MAEKKSVYVIKHEMVKLNGKAQPGREFVIKHLFSKLRHCD